MGLNPMKLRLAALEKESADEGLVLTEAQVARLLKRRNRMMKLAVKLKTAHPRVILAARILFGWGQSRELAAFISKHLLTPIPKWLLPRRLRLKRP